MRRTGAIRVWYLALGLCFSFAAGAAAGEAQLLELVNPLQGTDSTREFSHGNTYPAVALPFPMNAWSPYTQPAEDRFFYQYRQNKFRGIRQTHQPSPWMGDYATFSFMPVSGKLAVKEDERASAFQHQNEIAQPGYYKAQLETANTIVEVTPTERAARFRFTFNAPGDSYVVLDAFAGKSVSVVEIVPAENKIIGITRNSRGGVPPNFANYFVIVFDRPLQGFGTWSSSAIQESQTRLESKEPMGAFVKFDTSAERVVTFKVASSFISAEQAARNLQQEIGEADFDTIRARAADGWNKALGRIRVEGGSLEQQRAFYSAFYRTLLFPEKFYEMDDRGKPFYFSPYDGKVHSGYLYTNSGFWDTFRGVHPLLNLLFPEVSAEILPGLLSAYDESGWLPAWSSPGHRDVMIGNHAFSLLADGWIKGVRTFDAQRAVAAMRHDSTTQGPPKLSTVGRDGAKYYSTIGYVPYSNAPHAADSVIEAGAKTLEFAYDDFCAAQLAKAIGRKTDAEAFGKNAKNYANLFDAKTGFMRGRKADGSWNEPFYPEEWGGPFTEGNAWHWTWSVVQDVPGLIKLMGGEKAFVSKLDAVFAAAPAVKVGTYGEVIHEMTEMVAANLGQYAHGNEPVHHVIYLYDYAGQPWKTQARVRQVMTLLYQPTPDGLCGDEDNGQMSAWYLWSALGFYPVCPGDPNYLIGSPVFDKATLNFAHGKQFVVQADGNGPQQPYIRGAKLNGIPFNKIYLNHEDLIKGGQLTFTMSSAPDYEWGSLPASRPPSALASVMAP